NLLRRVTMLTGRRSLRRSSAAVMTDACKGSKKSSDSSWPIRTKPPLSASSEAIRLRSSSRSAISDGSERIVLAPPLRVVGEAIHPSAFIQPVRWHLGVLAVLRKFERLHRRKQLGNGRTAIGIFVLTANYGRVGPLCIKS